MIQDDDFIKYVKNLGRKKKSIEIKTKEEIEWVTIKVSENCNEKKVIFKTWD